MGRASAMLIVIPISKLRVIGDAWGVNEGQAASVGDGLAQRR